MTVLIIDLMFMAWLFICSFFWYWVGKRESKRMYSDGYEDGWYECDLTYDQTITSGTAGVFKAKKITS